MSFVRSEKKNEAFMIIALINQLVIKRTLVENDSTLNVCSINLLDKIKVDKIQIQPDSLSIRGFDNIGKKPLGVITLPITIGKETLQTPVDVMPHDLSYNLLLGRQWIHEMNGMPSTLHRKMKYLYNNKVHTIKADPQLDSFLIEKKGKSFENIDTNYTSGAHTREIKIKEY